MFFNRIPREMVTHRKQQKHKNAEKERIEKTLEKTEEAIIKWTIQRNRQHRAHKTKKDKTKTQHNMCLDTTIGNQVQTT